jgi:hypothetical protein
MRDTYKETRAKLDNVIQTLNGTQPLDIAGAIAALQSMQSAEQLFVCRHCGTDTMVENWRGSGIDQMHCVTCER